jgi:hypothetical protein
LLVSGYQTIATVPHKVAPERVNEIKIAISKESHFVLEAIVGGARVGITIESLDKIPEMSNEVLGYEKEDINEVLDKQKTLERQLTLEFQVLGPACPHSKSRTNSMSLDVSCPNQWR